MTSTKESVTYNVNLILHRILGIFYYYYFLETDAVLRPEPSELSKTCG